MDNVPAACPRHASVVVVGGGVIGLSAAYHLAASGVPDVVLVERDELGSGSTCKAAGGVRAQFSDAVNIQLGLRSLRTFETFREQFGQEIDLQQVGYLFLLERPEHVELFEKNVALQNELGVPSRMIEVAEAQRLSPLIDPEGLLAAAYSPTDGHCTPESVVLGYASAARRAGARLLRGTAVEGIEHDGRTIGAVRTTRGTIRTATVVCAAGAWSAEVGAMAGVDLPVTPERREIVVTEPVPGLDPRTPFTIDFASTFYFHAEGRGLLMGMSDPELLPEAVERRTPSLSGVGIASGWAGLYENTPDHNALIGESDEISRFLYATGFSGHGFLMGPAVGEVVRDLYHGDRPVVDVSALDVRRFDSGARPELNIV
jgi:sarcosine oxidase subunit beta